MASIILELGTGRTADCPDDIAKTLLAHTVNKTTSRRVKQFFKGIATMILVAGSSAGAAVGVSHYLDSKRPEHEPVAEIAHDIKRSADQLEAASVQQMAQLQSELDTMRMERDANDQQAMNAIIALQVDNDDARSTIQSIVSENATLIEALQSKIDELSKTLALQDQVETERGDLPNLDEEAARIEERQAALIERTRALEAQAAIIEATERMRAGEEEAKRELHDIKVIDRQLQSLSPSEPYFTR